VDLPAARRRKDRHGRERNSTSMLCAAFDESLANDRLLTEINSVCIEHGFNGP
jgi:hypothetical protein